VPGILGLAEAAFDRTWRSDEVAALQTVAAALSSTFAREKLFAQVQQASEVLEQRVEERTRELEREQRRAETLLDITSELSTSLDMDIVLNRTLRLINRLVGAEQSTIMLMRQDDATRKPSLLPGYATPAPEGAPPTPGALNQALAEWAVSHGGEAALISDLSADARWTLPDDRPVQGSGIAMPLAMGSEALGALLLYHGQPGHFSGEQLELVQATAGQIAVAINNAQLFNLIRDQAERLGGLLRTQQVEASRLRAILEAVADGVLVTDAAGTISVFNASAEAILGLTGEQVLNHSLDHFIGLFGRAAQQWTNTIRLWSARPEQAGGDDTFAEQITLEDGRVVAVNLAAVRWQDEFLGTVSIFRDITHQVEVDRLKSEFVATVSHELRTPMTSIKGYVDILLMGAAGPLTGAQENYLGVVKTNAERLNILVNDLLDVSKIEAGSVTYAMQPIALPEIAQRVIAEMEQRAREADKPMSFVLHTQPGLPRAFGDPERVQQIIHNLVENSWLYTPPEGRISLTLGRYDEGYVAVAVQDNGVGILPEDRDRVFERFFRGEHPLVLTSAGTGLGLPIVQHLVEYHNGWIWFESSGIPGEGATFTFTLPVYKPE